MPEFLASPVFGGVITARFGDVGTYWTNKHTGLDFAAPTLSPIRALADGRVKQSGWNGGAYGNTVTLDHSDGFVTVYAHMFQTTTGVDSFVTQGSIIGLVGTTGNVSGPHVHVEVHRNGQILDPEDYLGTDTGSANGGVGDSASMPDRQELGNRFVRLGYFLGGSGLLISGVFIARKQGVL